jgi:xanthine dehydrogenase accessory factor
MDAGGKIDGFSLDPEIQAQLRRELHSPVFPVLKHLDDRTYLLEKLASPGTVLIFGAGHVARPTLALAAKVGFKTGVLDDRPEFATAEHFPHSERIILVDSFANALTDVAVGDDAYLIIVTRGHHHDQTVLEQALATPAAYIGMMGSQKKIRACFDNLETRGWQKADLARVHSPIGLDIGSETPEEIAVSIVAELIAVRARLQGKKFRKEFRNADTGRI